MQLTRLSFFFIMVLCLSPGLLKSQCYELVWADEFDYTGFPESDFWTFEVGGDGWGNNELQYYKANDEDNSWVEDGILKITAIKENYGNRNYTSARIITRNKFNFQYGKIEARLKLPYGQGIWPAFWIMGESISDVGWPECGEIDIMEMVGGEGRDNVIHGTAHWDNNGSHAQYGGSYQLNEGIFADSFHTFTLEWSPSALRWYVDDNQYHVMSITPAGLSEFHDDFFILLNIAVGGLWPGNPDQTTVFPQTFEIDYVRVYKSAQQVKALEINGQDSLPAKGAGRNFSFPGPSDWTYEWIVPDDAEITSGQGTENVEVNWGCDSGKLICNVTGSCDSYNFEKNIIVNNQIYANMFISPGEEDVLFFTDTLSESSLEWTVPSDALITEGQGTDSIWVDWGESFDKVELLVENSCGTNRLEYIPVITGQYPFPELAEPHKIPGIIEAVNFDYGGEGLAYHDLSAWNEGPGPRQDEYVDTEYNDNGNPNVGWIRSGEWIEYTISVDSAYWYDLDMRVASANSSGGPFSVLFNDKEKLHGITVNGTGAWDSFSTINAGTVYLTPEDTLMTLNFKVGNFNLGKMTFTPGSDPSVNLTDNKVGNIVVYPIPSVDFLMIQSDVSIRELMIFDMKGKMVYSEKLPGLRRADMDIRNINSGIYLLKVFTTVGEIQQKLILIAK